MATSMSMQDLMAPNLQQHEPSGLSKAADMAGTMQNLETAKTKQSQLQNDLQDAQYKTISGTTSTAMSMSDPIFKVSEKQMEKRLKQVNPDYQEGTLAALRSDPELQAGMQAYHQAIATGEMPTDAEHKKMVIDAFGNPGQAEQLINTFNEQRKMNQARDLKEAMLVNQKNIADNRNTTSSSNNTASNASRERAAGMRYSAGSPGALRAESTINNNYSRAINAVDQLKTTLSDVDSGKLSDAKNVKAEIESKMASVFGGGKPSTVFGQQAVGLDSAYGDFQNKMNHIFGEAKGVLTEAQKKQLHQELDTFGSNAAKQHEDAFLTHLELVNPAYRGPVEQSYARYRMQKGLPSNIDYTGSAPPPVTGTGKAPQPNGAPPPAAPQLSPNQQAYMQAMQAAGLNPEQATQRMQEKRIK